MWGVGECQTQWDMWDQTNIFYTRSTLKSSLCTSNYKKDELAKKNIVLANGKQEILEK